MARTRSHHRRATAAAALSVLCFGFSLPATASDTAVDASANGLARAAEARGDVEVVDDAGDDGGSVTIQNIAWK